MEATSASRRVKGVSLKRRAPELDGLHLDIVVYLSRAGGRQAAGRRRQRRAHWGAKRAEVGERKGNIDSRERSVVGRVLDDIERHVAEVPVVGNAIARPETVLPLPKIS